MVTTVTNSVISLFLIMTVGVYGSKKGIITSELNNGLINILLNIALPFMVISSFMITFDESIKSNVLKAFNYSLITYLILIAVSYILVLHVKGEKKTIIHFANVFTNTGYIGFPVLNAIYGPEGVVYGSIFNMFFVLFLWTYGVLLFKGHMDKEELIKEIRKTLLNPSIIAVAIGVIILLLNLNIPQILFSSIKSIGSITGPLSMIIVGAILSRVKFKNNLKDFILYYGITTKLVVLPMILYLISILINDRSIVANSVIIIASMPAAAMTSIFAESYDKEKDFAAIYVLMTTLLSIITIPILVNILV